jgi:hypothetical protein
LAGAALLLGIATAAAQDKPIKLGAVLATQGGPAFLGDPEAKVLRLYVEKINGAGGVLGRKIELVLYETNGAAADAVNFAKRAAGCRPSRTRARRAGRRGSSRSAGSRRAGRAATDR